ncbi:MAG TPA: hypothetical protein VK009_02060 [Chloroflexota bacterium]|nr:hypothetical protein [Chloroflexota bacterium]
MYDPDHNPRVLRSMPLGYHLARPRRRVPFRLLLSCGCALLVLAALAERLIRLH